MIMTSRRRGNSGTRVEHNSEGDPIMEIWKIISDIGVIPVLIFLTVEMYRTRQSNMIIVRWLKRHCPNCRGIEIITKG